MTVAEPSAPRSDGHHGGATASAGAPVGRERLAGPVGHLVIAIAATAPLAWNLERLPLGTEPTRTVPQFNLWTLEWTADRLPHGLAGWWDAAIFWPQRGAFAFSEPQPLTGAAFALVRPLFGSVAAYSAILVLTVALNGVTGAALARRLGAGPVPAFLAGVLAQALPFTFDQLGVLQLTALWPLLAATACLVAWLEQPRRRHAALLGLSVTAAVGTCGYYALLYVLCLLLAAPIAIDRTWLTDRRARIAGVLVAAAPVLLLTGPIAVGQQERLDGHRWSTATIAAGSASWPDWTPTGSLWPGSVLVALAVAGLVIGRRRRSTRLLVALAAASLVASLGTNLSFLGLRPWPFLVEHVDAVARLRSPFRAAAVTQLALAGLAAPALGWLWTRRSVAARVAAPVLVAVAVLTAGLGAGTLVDPPPVPGRWATWLADHPDGGAVAFLPFVPGRRARDFAPTTTRMLQNLDTGHPMLNGYSGFFPSDHTDLRDDLRGFPDERSLDALQRHGTRYVVITPATFDRFDRRIATDLGLTVILHDDDAYLVRVPQP